MPSALYDNLSQGLTRLERAFLNFSPRPSGNYTERQLTMAAAYTVFCHAEIESYLEGWASTFVDLADTSWKSRRATQPLVHICTFHEGRAALTSVPKKDVWNEVVGKALAKQRGVISRNHGIKETNFCELLSPVGFNTTNVDSVLLADLTAFGTLRGDHAHNSHRALIGTTFDPFDRRKKVLGLSALLLVLDSQLEAYLAAA
ncbi:hypothetical protein H0274_00970 [Altererythrobacter sp. CC-YST694]|uniref:hypothetical protein n=1 Tax=Altererythrobacter sp. CC-YST694 TaxID=2755038 RepID=UPI001D0204B6|nr:hypothetical protein [Altererythrobacter sp. CC-YST694]MCB5423813.1 hypothetical protein [Altererythrobacter sp. CC-YST694]